MLDPILPTFSEQDCNLSGHSREKMTTWCYSERVWTGRRCVEKCSAIGFTCSSALGSTGGRGAGDCPLLDLGQCFTGLTDFEELLSA
jgi:hypothetical protein